MNVITYEITYTITFVMESNIQPAHVIEMEISVIITSEISVVITIKNGPPELSYFDLVRSILD